jgi:hypothetical protein
MLDIETMGTRPDTVILTLAATKFDPYTISNTTACLYIKPNVDEQLERGRSHSEDTLEWWSKQDPIVREEAFSEDMRVDVNFMLGEINRFMVGVDEIWCQGPVFDIGILENIYRQYQRPAPWQFYQIRDSRTLFAVHGDPRDKNKSGLHNALEDCISQVAAVQSIYQRLGIKSKFNK